jgi:folylpolyglutamate synthase/dihydropteroate synthase
VLAASPTEALARAAALPETGPVVVAGSLYLVGAVRGALTGEPEDA